MVQKIGLNTFPPDLMAIAMSLMDVGRAEEALSYMRTHISTKNFAPPITQELLSGTYLKLSRVLVRQRKLDDAERAITQALKVDAKSTSARLALGDLYLVRRRKADAAKQYRELLKSSPRQPMALNNLAWILATSKDAKLKNPADAVMFAERLCELTKHGEPISLDTYSVALAADGQFEKAIEWLQKAIALAKQNGRSTKNMERRLKLFQAQESYEE